MNEIFNSTVQLHWRQAAPDRTEATFTIGDKQYRLFIEAGTYQFQSHPINFLNAEFDRLDDLTGNWTRKMMDDTENAHYVLGAVVNGLHTQINQYDTDAVVLAAVDNVEQRHRIYLWVARRFHKEFGGLLEDVPTKFEKSIILLGAAFHTNTELVLAFKEYIKTQDKL